MWKIVKGPSDGVPSLAPRPCPQVYKAGWIKWSWKKVKLNSAIDTTLTLSSSTPFNTTNVRYYLTQNLWAYMQSWHFVFLYNNNLLCAECEKVFGNKVCLCFYCCVGVCVTATSSLPPRLAAQHAHAGHVDAYEPPRHQVLERGQRAHKSVRVGAVGVPVPRVDPQAAGAARVPAVAGGLEEVLLLGDIVDVHVWQHCHLSACDVRGFGLVADPGADALAHWVNSTVLRLPGAPAGPPAGGTLWVCRLHIRGPAAEDHPGWAVAAFGEELGVDCGDGAGLAAGTLVLCCSSDGGHSLGTEEEEQDQHGRPHGHTTWGLSSSTLNFQCIFLSDFIIDSSHTLLVPTGSMGTLATVCNPHNHSRVLKTEEIPSNAETCWLQGECLSLSSVIHETPELLHGLYNGPNNYTAV